MFEKALDINPNDKPSLFHLGLMQHKNGDLKDALNSFSKVLSVVGDDRLVEFPLIHFSIKFCIIKRFLKVED